MQNCHPRFLCLASPAFMDTVYRLMRKQLLLVLSAAMGMLLPSCVVYMPMQCAAPQITDKNQVEVTGSSFLNGRFDVAGTYSPVNHLLVRAAYSAACSDTAGKKDYSRGDQYDLGVGTYWRVGNKWLVGALGGFGTAQSQVAYTSGGFLSRVSQSKYDLHYNKHFGEIYGTYRASNLFSTGVAFRVTQVNFTRLTLDHQPVELTGMTRMEPMGFVRLRVGKGSFEERPVQFQVAIGASGTAGFNEKDVSSYGHLPEGVYALKQTRNYATISVTLFPHCLFRKPPPGNSGQ